MEPAMKRTQNPDDERLTKSGRLRRRDLEEALKKAEPSHDRGRATEADRQASKRVPRETQRG
jgi:hypothetical protein